MRRCLRTCKRKRPGGGQISDPSDHRTGRFAKFSLLQKKRLRGAVAEHEKDLAAQRKKAAQFGRHGAGNISRAEEAGRTSDIIAKKVGLGSGKTLEAAQKVAAHGTPELVAAMDAGNGP